MNWYAGVTAFPTLFSRTDDRRRERQGDLAVGAGEVGTQDWPRILLVAETESPDWQDPVAWIMAQQVMVVRAPNRQFPRDWLSCYPDDFALMIVDCEYVGNFGDVVEYTLSLRQRSPDTPVILASRHFNRNEFGSQTSVILNSALKMPFTRSSLFLAISAATDGNRRHMRVV